MNVEIWKIIGVILGALTTGWFGWRVEAARRRTSSHAEIQATAVDWAAQLLARVESLEDDMKEMKERYTLSQRRLYLTGMFVDKVGMWLSSGGEDHARPHPSPEIQEVIDPAYWV